MFRFINAIPLAIKCVLLHKLRSLLTMLGIVFGVFSVIAMMAIGEGASQQAQNQVLELGATNIIVLSVKPPQETSASQQAQGGFVLRYGLKRDDFSLLSGTLHTVTNAIPIREVAVEARYLHRAMNVRLVGGTSEYRDVNHLKLSRGRFISDQDQRDYAKVVVLAKETADTLFPFEDPID